MSAAKKRNPIQVVPEKIYTLAVVLRGSDPAIWRRIEVGDTMTLGGLHEVIQTVMPWTNSHLHEFEVKGVRYGAKGGFDGFFDMDDDLDEEDESQIVLADIIRRKGQKILYTYDFGDGWQHRITVEATGKPAPGTHYPVCTGGERACPPEDCGGMWGYYEMLEAVADPKHEKHANYLEWLGEDFDPDAFDLDSVNRQLQANPR